jgi:hypothetical protein
MTMSRKKHDTAPVTAAAALAHDLLGEEKDNAARGPDFDAL